MASAWGSSWGSSWNDSWGAVAAPVVVAIQPGGGDSLRKLKLDAERRRRKQDEAKEIERLEAGRKARRERKKKLVTAAQEEAGRPALRELEPNLAAEMEVAAAEASALASLVEAETEIARREAAEVLRRKREIFKQRLADTRARWAAQDEEDAVVALLLAA